MLKQTIKKIMTRVARKKGYSPYMAPKVWQKICDDFFDNKNISIKQKIWAYKRGFLSETAWRLGLNDNNYQLYLPDLKYLRFHPINGAYSHWIDDKLTMKYVFRDYDEYLPKYHYKLQGSHVMPLLDCPHPKQTTYSHDHVLDLLKNVHRLAVKPESGSGGKGFFKLSSENSFFYIDNKETSKEKMISFLGTLKGYLVTEYINSHPDIQKIYEITPNTLRLMVVNTIQTGPKITGAFMRFGTTATGMVDNITAGGISCGVKLTDGELFSPKHISKGQIKNIETHPDSLVPIKLKLPNWDFITKKIVEIGCDFPQLIYMGYDVIITESGFKIIEINSHQELKNLQLYYPVLKNDDCRQFFETLN